jgi:hypothetical protein
LNTFILGKWIVFARHWIMDAERSSQIHGDIFNV